MKRITIKLSVEELELLTSLAADQVFRREFIDPKMPGHRRNPEEIASSKAIIGQLRALLKSNSPMAQRSPDDAPPSISRVAP